VRTILLTEIKQGDRVRIIDTANVNPIVQQRLVDLDIMEGSVVSVKRILPFRGPIAIEIDGQCIGIRRQEALGIQVERI
jgi:ferrous iron transport protein A